MEIFKQGRYTLIAVPQSEVANASEALKAANNHFKRSYSDLVVTEGSTNKDKLYFEIKKGYKKIWIVQTKSMYTKDKLLNKINQQ